MLLLHIDILKEITKNIKYCIENDFSWDSCLISNKYFVLFNNNINKYCCFEHYYDKNLVEALIYCNDVKHSLHCNKIYYLTDEHITEKFLKKYESFIKV